MQALQNEAPSEDKDMMRKLTTADLIEITVYISAKGMGTQE